VPDCDENGSIENGPAGQLVSKEPDPLALVIEAERLERLLLPLTEMTLLQQQLFVRHYLHEVRLVDLLEETGRTAQCPLPRDVYHPQTAEEAPRRRGGEC